MSREDLAAYQPVERPPVTGTYRGYRIVSMPPPSCGGIAVIELLNVLEGFPLAEVRAPDRRRRARARGGRAARLRRPRAVGRRPRLRPCTGHGPHVQAVRRHGCVATIDPTHATPSTAIAAGMAQALESLETTHYSVVDADGNAVAVTTTLNGGYGNGQVVPGAGFLLNNEMDDFTARPGRPNSVGLVSGRRTRSRRASAC